MLRCCEIFQLEGGLAAGDTCCEDYRMVRKKGGMLTACLAELVVSSGRIRLLLVMVMVLLEVVRGLMGDEREDLGGLRDGSVRR
jgi:uncharacterized membrane protein